MQGAFFLFLIIALLAPLIIAAATVAGVMVLVLAWSLLVHRSQRRQELRELAEDWQAVVDQRVTRHF